MTDPVTYNITQKRGDYAGSTLLQKRVETQLSVTFDLEGKTLSYYFGHDPGRGSVPHTLLKQAQTIFDNKDKPTGKYSLGAVMYALRGKKINWSLVDGYLTNQNNLVTHDSRSSKETITTISEDQVVEALLVGASLNPANYTREAVAAKKLTTDIPTLAVADITALLSTRIDPVTINETSYSRATVTEVLKRTEVQAALLDWVIAHPVDAAGIIGTVKPHLPQGTIVIQFQEEGKEKVAVVVRQTEGGSWQIQGNKFSGYTVALEVTGNSRAFKVTPSSATAIEAEVVAGEIPAETATTSSPSSPPPPPPPPTATNQLQWLLTTSGLLVIEDAAGDDRKDNKITQAEWNSGNFTVNGTRVTLADGLSWEEAEALGFTRAAYDFFSTGGVVGVKGDAAITQDDIAAVKKYHIDQIIAGLGADAAKGVVERYVKAATYRIVPVNEAARATLQQEEAVGAATISASRLLASIGEGNREGASKLLWRMLGKTGEYVSGTSSFAETDILDAAALARFYATLAFLAQVPKSEELRKSYPLNTDNIADLSLFTDPLKFLKWLKGEKVEREEAAGRGGEELNSSFAKTRDQYFTVSGTGDSASVTLKTGIDRKKAKKELTDLLEKLLATAATDQAARDLAEATLQLAAVLNEPGFLEELSKKIIGTDTNSKLILLRAKVFILQERQKALAAATTDNRQRRLTEFSTALTEAYKLSVEEILNREELTDNDRSTVSGMIVAIIATAAETEGFDLSTLNLVNLPIEKMPVDLLKTKLFPMLHQLGVQKSREHDDKKTEASKKDSLKDAALILLKLAKKILELGVMGRRITYTTGQGSNATTTTVTTKNVEELIGRLEPVKSKAERSSSAHRKPSPAPSGGSRLSPRTSHLTN